MPRIIIEHELRVALIHSDKNKAIEIIELNNLDVNSVIDDDNSSTILFGAVNALNEFHGSISQLELVEYLLAKGADPNIKTSENDNSLHVSLEFHDLSEVALLLITKGGADVNSVESHGSSPLFIAIREYRLTWRPEQKRLNELRFTIIEELLKRGADLDAVNRHGVSPRRWLELAHDTRLDELVRKYEK